jgi:hypothetical protein
MNSGECGSLRVSLRSFPAAYTQAPRKCVTNSRWLIMEFQPACRYCQHHSRPGSVSICKLRGMRVRADYLCEEFDFKNTGARTLTPGELDSLHTLTKAADGHRAWDKKNSGL